LFCCHNLNKKTRYIFIGDLFSAIVIWYKKINLPGLATPLVCLGISANVDWSFRFAEIPTQLKTA